MIIAGKRGKRERASIRYLPVRRIEIGLKNGMRKMNNLSLLSLNTTISTWFWIRFKVFNHSGKNYLLIFKIIFAGNTLTMDFLNFIFDNEFRRIRFIILRGLTGSLWKKIFRNNPSYEFFQKIFFPKSFNHPKFTKKTSIWASKSLN